jgi:nitrite reductase/ring-hydroxylating ferredoxin subunit
MQSPTRVSTFASSSSSPARLANGVLSLDERVSASINVLEVGGFVTITGRTGRSIAVLRTTAGLSAMDLRCFHHGAALGADGRMSVLDIENVGPAVQCPAHGRWIDVTTGEQLVADGMRGGAACSWRRTDGGMQQRVHEVRVDEAGGVHLRLSEQARIVDHLPSDAYNLTPHASPHASPQHASAHSSAHVSPHASPHSLAFACRKNRATEAVQRKLTPGASPQTSPHHASESLQRQALAMARAHGEHAKAPRSLRYDSEPDLPAAATAHPHATNGAAGEEDDAADDEMDIS